MQSVKMVECLKFHLFNYLHSDFSDVAVPHQSGLSACQLPPGGSLGRSRAIAINNNLSSHRLAYAFRSKQQACFSIFPIDKPPSLGYTYFNT